MSDLSPSEIFARYERKELDRFTAIAYLKDIIERFENEPLRLEALEQLGNININDTGIYSFLEGVVLSDTNYALRLEAAKLVFRDFFEEGRAALAHIIEHETSADVLYGLYKTLERVNSVQSNQFLTQMELSLSKEYIEKFDITSKEAMALKLMEYQVGFEIKLYIYTFDEEHISIKPENGHVVSLDIFGLNFPEIKYMEFLPYLKFLTIQDTGLTQIKGLEPLINLTFLDLTDNKITEIKGLDSLKNLETLDLSFNPITEIKGLENLKRLKDVNFEDNEIPEDEIENFYNNFIPMLKRRLYDCWRSKEYEKALELCNRIIFLDPKQKEAFLYIGRIKFAMGELKDSIKFYQKALKLDNKYQLARYNLGILYKSINKRIFALTYFFLALRSKTSEVNREYIYLYIARIFSDWQAYHKALKYALKSIESNSEYITGYVDAGYYYYKLENYNQAIIFMRRALEKYPHDLTYKRYLGLFYFENKMWSDAKKIFFQIITNHPKDVLSRIKLGQALINENKFTKAKKNLKKLIDFEDLDYNYCRVLALDFVTLKEYDLALSFINRAIDQEPKLKSLHKIRKQILKKKKLIKFSYLSTPNKFLRISGIPRSAIVVNSLPKFLMFLIALPFSPDAGVRSYNSSLFLIGIGSGL